jgi:uncharacterized phosphatase
MKRLYFVRHGQSELNLQHIYAGQIDTPLTDKGREQAKLAGAKAKDIQIDMIISSPLIRALETAQIIASASGYPADDIFTNPVFMERSYGSLGGKSWDEVDEDETQFPDMESWQALLTRARSGLDLLEDFDADTILLVGHGSFADALRTTINPDGAYSELPNAEIVQLI